MPSSTVKRDENVELETGEWHSWLEFTDGAGQVWQRDMRGRLQEIRTPWTRRFRERRNARDSGASPP